MLAHCASVGKRRTSRGKENTRYLGTVPPGTEESSPPFQRWVNWPQLPQSPARDGRAYDVSEGAGLLTRIRIALSRSEDGILGGTSPISDEAASGDDWKSAVA